MGHSSKAPLSTFPQLSIHSSELFFFLTKTFVGKKVHLCSKSALCQKALQSARDSTKHTASMNCLGCEAPLYVGQAARCLSEVTWWSGSTGFLLWGRYTAIGGLELSRPVVEKTREGSSILKLSRSGVEKTREGSKASVSWLLFRPSGHQF